MTTTFNCRISDEQWADLISLNLKYRREKHSDGTVDLTFSDQSEWNRFEEWAEENDIDYHLI